MRAMLAFVISILAAGSLGDPSSAGEVPFERIQREHFDALAVSREMAAPSPATLTLRVTRVGDAVDADLTEAYAWLAANANVHIVDGPNGAPLFLTRLDLTATSGRATLGATVRSGMSVEVRDEAIGNCVMAHEALHLLGLHHVGDARNIMYSHCRAGFLAVATLSADQKAFADSISSIRATTTRGVETWAARLA